MNENGNWYDHLKPSNNAEAGCYFLIVFLFLWGLGIYLELVYALEVTGRLFILAWVYWSAYTTASRRSKGLESSSLPASKLHLVAFLLMLSGLAGLLFVQGVSYLIFPLEILVISLVWGLVSLAGFVFFLARLERLTDFFLRYVSKD